MIYVDEPNKRYGRMLMCHLFSADTEELHLMADRIGIKRKWFQDTKYPHYDICKSKRSAAIDLGAVPVDNRRMVLIMQGKIK